MKLKHIHAIAFVLVASAAYCGPSDSLHTKKATHHFQLLIGNYAGESFFNPNTKTQLPLYIPPGQIIYNTKNLSYNYYKPSFIPMYSYSIGFDYKADLSNHIGIRTGINYFTYAYIAEGLYDPCPECEWDVMQNVKYKRFVFVSSFHIPLQILAYKPLKRGRFVFAAGPDLYLPIYTFDKQTIYFPGLDPSYNRNTTNQSYVRGSDFFKGGSMGFSMGLGYEKVLSKKFSIELLPDIHIMNLVPFDFQGQGTGIYKNYIFNTSVGLSTYLSFSK
jgi:hypothetical protein